MLERVRTLAARQAVERTASDLDAAVNGKVNSWCVVLRALCARCRCCVCHAAPMP